VRLTPAQIAVRLICGQKLPPPGEARIRGNSTLAERIKLGRDLLVKIAKADFGYDLVAWHGHLKESRDGGYTWGRNIALSRIMKEAIESHDWQEAVRELQSENRS